MDNIPVDKIKEYEQGLLDYSESRAKKFFKEINETKMWTDAGETELKKIIEEYTKSFKK